MTIEEQLAEHSLAIDTLKRQLELIQNRHARYRKIKALEDKLKVVKDALRDLNKVIPFPLPEWFTEDIQRRVVAALH